MPTLVRIQLCPYEAIQQKPYTRRHYLLQYTSEQNYTMTTDEITRQVNAEGTVIKTVSVASDGEQIGASILGLFTAGPLGALAAWGAIRMFAGKWTPWLLTGIVASGPLWFIQLMILGAIIGSAADATELPVTERIEEVRREV